MQSRLRIKLFFILLLLVFSGCHKEDDPPEIQFESFPEELDYLVGEYVRMGAAIGIIDKSQVLHEYYFGRITQSREEAPDSHSIFELGSITKSFTATLLAQMILEGKVKLEDELETLLPEGEVTVPDWNGTRITLQHLATHSSGLPKKPQDSSQPLPREYDPYDPYAAYTTADVYDYLTSYCDLLFEPGTQYFYSNTGLGLVGHVLGLVDSSSYAELLQEKILDPLEMNETILFLTEDQNPDLAPGHDERLSRVNNYNAQDIFQGALSLKSTLHDMLIYLQVQLGLIGTGLDEAIDMTHQVYFDVGGVTYGDREGYYQLSIGLAWHMDLLPEGNTFCWHGGRTNGYMAYLAFDMDALTGVIILCNQSYEGVITRFGEDLLKAVNKYDQLQF